MPQPMSGIGFIISILIALGLWLMSIIDSPVPYSQITFTQSSFIDKVLCPLTGELVSETDRKELEKIIPLFQRLWNDQSTSFLAATEKILGAPLRLHTDKSSFFVCKNIPSWAIPMMISSWSHLSSAGPGKTSRPVDIVNVVYHEFLHVLTLRLLDWKLES